MTTTQTHLNGHSPLLKPGKKLTIGLFGFGVVGEGLYRILHQTPSLNATIKKVCIKNPDKKRNAPAELFTTDRNELLNDPEINVIVEVISESEAAFRIVSAALRNGKAAVSSSKKMIAEHLPELLNLQQESGQPFLYESSSCASIPIIRNLEEYYDHDLLYSIKAIVNGSTNYILTKMFDERSEFSTALAEAQQLGFAEADPTLDIDGWDAVNKWSILLTHAYGLIAPPSKILFSGIGNIQRSDAEAGRAKNSQVKLVAQAKKLSDGRIAAFVLPQFVRDHDLLAFVRHEYNGVVVESSFSDKQFFYGKGAGSFPTASAVLSDISALRYDYRYEYKKRYQHLPSELSDDFYLKVYLSFDDAELIPRERFVSIDEYYVNQSRRYLVGILPFAELRSSTWWKQEGVSLILTPDPVIEAAELPQLKPKKETVNA